MLNFTFLVKLLILNIYLDSDFIPDVNIKSAFLYSHIENPNIYIITLFHR